jgi:hypothetical protein
MTSDAMKVLRDSDPARAVGAYDERRAAEVLARAAATIRRPRRRRRTVGSLTAGVGAVVALAAGSGGLAWAVTEALRQEPATALKVYCSVGMDRSSFEAQDGSGSGVTIDASSGDPVADCAAEYKRLEGAAPALAAYESGESFVTVLPVGWRVPPEWTALAADFRNDPARLELKQRLDDLVDGPQSRCSTADDVERIVRAELEDLRLGAWAVERLSQADRADGRPDWCALAMVDEQGLAKVYVQGLEDFHPASPDTSLAVLARDLRTGIADQCLTLPAARRRAEEAIVSSDFTLDQARIATVTEQTSCTRIDFVPGGMIVVVLRGPQH